MEISVLQIEDDERLAAFTASYLSNHGVKTCTIAHGDEALPALARGGFHLVLLDLMLPGRDGLRLCREIRLSSDIPIIILTGRSEEPDRVLGLELGADDYVVKPFSARELLARIRALVRRYTGEVGPCARTIRIGPLELTPSSRSAKLNDWTLELTTREFDLLKALTLNANRVLTRNQLIDLVGGGASEPFERSIDVQVSRLRSKLESLNGGENIIRTVRGVGYMMSVH